MTNEKGTTPRRRAIIGYYAEFQFSVVIPTAKVAGAEKALAESERFGKEFKEAHNSSISEFLQEYWLDMGPDEIYFEQDVSALAELANAAESDTDLRGDLTIEGFTHQKWRSYAEDMFDILAPYIQTDSIVEIKGEEGEQLRWEFDGESRSESYATVMWPAELNALHLAQAELNALHLAQAELNSLHLAQRALEEIVTQLRTGATHIVCGPIIHKYRPDLLTTKEVTA